MLSEASTTEIARSEDAQGFVKNKGVAQRGDAVPAKRASNLKWKRRKRSLVKKIISLKQIRKMRFNN